MLAFIGNLNNWTGSNTARQDLFFAPFDVTAPALSISKVAAPGAAVTYHSIVTYTVVLSNPGPLDDANVIFTNALPNETGFSHWVKQLSGASVGNGEITYRW